MKGVYVCPSYRNLITRVLCVHHRLVLLLKLDMITVSHCKITDTSFSNILTVTFRAVGRNKLSVI